MLNSSREERDDYEEEEEDGDVWNFEEFSPEKFLEFSGINCEDVEVVGGGRV